jgi:hypothetical protein
VLASSLALALGLSLALAMGCSGGDATDGKPGTMRVLKAIVTSFLSNSVDAEKQADASEGETPSRAPEPAPDFAALDPEPAETCVIPYNGPVTIIPVRSPSVLSRTIAERRDARLVYATEDTAIWEDGRILTMNLEDLGTHLNAVGWASNPMQILGASTRPGSSSSNLGWGSGQTSFQTPIVKKRKRRRG